MKKLFLSLTIALILAFTGGTAFAATFSLSVESLRFNADDRQDIMGVNSSQNADGRTDASFNLDVSGTNAIREISLKNESTGRMWSSDPNGSTELLLIKDSNGSTLNSSGRLTTIPVLLGANFRLYINDAQASIPRDSTFVVTIKLIDNNETTGRTTVRSLGYSTPNTNNGYGDGIIDLTYNGITRSDYANNGERVGSDGRDDTLFKANLRFNNATIRSMKLTAWSGSRTGEWDTIADNRVPILTVVDSSNRIVNNSNGDVYFNIRGTEYVSLLVQDNDRLLSDNNAKAALTITLSDGRVFEGQAVIGNNSSAGNNYDPNYNVTKEDREVRFTSARPALVNLDLVGKNNKKQGDGYKDTYLNIQVTGKGHISQMVLTNNSGSGTWDTISGKSTWLLGVRSGNKLLNNNNKKVNIPVNGTKSYKLLMQDNGALSKANGKLTLSITWGDKKVTHTTLSWDDTTSNNSDVTKEDREVRFTSVRPALINLDLVGKDNRNQGNGYQDSYLNIQVTGAGHISQMVLTNNEGSGTWDTISGKSTWLLGVRSGNKLLNSSNKEVSIPVNGTKSYQLLMQDNGALRQRHGKLALSITWGDNQVTNTTLSW